MEPHSTRKNENPQFNITDAVKDWMENLKVENHSLDFKTLRNILSVCQPQYFHQYEQDDAEALADLAIHLFTILASGELVIDSQLLASTTLCAVIYSALSKSSSSRVFGVCLEDSKNQSPIFIYVSLFPNKNTDLVILNVDNFQLGLCNVLLQRNFSDQNNYDAVFNILQNLCKKYSAVTHIAFKLLLLWLHNAEKLFPEEILDIYKAKTIFCVVNNNWDNPLKGVRKENVLILEFLLKVADSKDSLVMFSAVQLLPTVLCDQSWTVRSKFFMLEALLPKYGIIEALKRFPDLAEGIVSSVHHNYLVAAGCNAYLALLKELKTPEEWQDYFLLPVLNILAADVNDNSFSIKNMLNYFISIAIKKFPTLLCVLLQHLCVIIDRCGSPLFLPIIYLVNLGRTQGFIHELWNSSWVSNQDELWCEDLLTMSLRHSNEYIRNYGFSAVCSHSSSHVVPSRQEFEAVKEFLGQNATADNASLRQGILNCMKVFLIRIRDSFLNEIKNQGSRNPSLISGEFSALSNEFLLKVKDSIEFLEWLCEFLLSNLDPGSNYQRKCISVYLFGQVLTYLSSNICADNSKKNQRDKKLNISTNWNVKEYTSKIRRWPFNSVLSYNSLLACIMDPSEDIRVTACSILAEHFSYNIKTYKIDTAAVLERAFDLCSRPSVHETESGALLMKLLSVLLDRNNLSLPGRIHKELNKNKERAIVEISFSTKGFETQTIDSSIGKSQQFLSDPEQQSDEREKAIMPPVQHITVVGLLIARAKSQWSAMYQDLYLAASKGSPLHGVLMALVHLVLCPHTPPYTRPCVTTEDIEVIVDLLHQVVEHLLLVLSSKTNTLPATSPSFAEMSVAIEEAILRSATGDLLGELQEEQVSPAHQLVLNCIWVNLKVCCLLSSELSKDLETPPSIVDRAVNLIVKVLTLCRHKGAIEAAGASLASFVRSATSVHEVRPEVQSMPKSILVKFLNLLKETGVSNLSVTRKSAGLGILVHRIVASDMHPEKPLLHVCMEVVLAVASDPPHIQMGPEENLFDLPETQALHFLCTLVQDSTLRQDMLCYISHVTILCLNKFDSPIWTVRNAALQLFGVLVPKLVGANKVQDDSSEDHGHMNIEEFISHYPRLVNVIQVFLGSMIVQTTSHFSKLVPVLSLLSKLSVGSSVLVEDSLKSIISSLRMFVSLSACNDSYQVRNLVAKAFSRLFSFRQSKVAMRNIKRVLQEKTSVTENELNGMLLSLKCMKENLKHEPSAASTLLVTNELTYINELPYIFSTSWCNKSLVVELSNKRLFSGSVCAENGNTTIELLRGILTALNVSENNSDPAFFNYVKIEIELIFKTCLHVDLCETWLFLYAGNFDELAMYAMDIIESRFREEYDIDISKSTLCNELIVIVLQRPWQRSTSLLFCLLRMILKLLLESQVTCEVSLRNLVLFHKQHIYQGISPSCTSVALAVLCGLTKRIPVDELQLNEMFLLFLLQLAQDITYRSDAKFSDESNRMYAATAFHLLISMVCDVFNDTFEGTSPSEQCVITAIGEGLLNAGVTLLQDENCDVRKEVTKFFAKFMHTNAESQTLNPYVCLETLLQPRFLLNFFTEDGMALILCRKLVDIKQPHQEIKKYYENTSCDSPISPFDLGTNNIYAEDIRITKIVGNGLLSLIPVAEPHIIRYLQHLIANAVPTAEQNKRFHMAVKETNNKVREAVLLLFVKYEFIRRSVRALRLKTESLNCD